MHFGIHQKLKSPEQKSAGADERAGDNQVDPWDLFRGGAELLADHSTSRNPKWRDDAGEEPVEGRFSAGIRDGCIVGELFDGLIVRKTFK
jgi:hypothetical protein